MEYVLALLFGLFVAFVWRLRGGAFSTLLKLSFGTDEARAFASLIIGAPFFFINPIYSITVIVSIMVGLLISGWGAFQNVLPFAGTPENSWLRWLPEKLGFPANTVGHNLIGLFESGIVLITPMFFAFTLLGFNAYSLLLMPIVFPLAYFIPTKLNLPTITNFVEGQSWGEVFVGFFLGLFLYIIS